MDHQRLYENLIAISIGMVLVISAWPKKNPNGKLSFFRSMILAAGSGMIGAAVTSNFHSIEGKIIATLCMVAIVFIAIFVQRKLSTSKHSNKAGIRSGL